MTDRDSASLMDGVFYGGAAYVFSYLFVYLGVLRQGDVKDRMVAAVTDQSTTSAANASELLDFLVPSTWKYAGWLYHYSTGGSIGVSINLLPGSYGLNHELMFPEVARTSRSYDRPYSRTRCDYPRSSAWSTRWRR